MAVSSAGGPAADLSYDYERKSMDTGLAIMTLPQPLSGPESLAFDRRGGGPNVLVCAPKKKLVVPESLCGRPLGLQFHMSGDLYVADAYLGLMRVPAQGGLAEVVATEAGGVPFNFLNGLDVDQETGDVYFTDSSTTYRRSENVLVVALGDETGRLLRYSPGTRRVAVLHAGLYYPNGVAVSADGSHVVVAHTATSELRRYWVRGAKAGTSETFVELPGFPDNVRPDGNGGYWVALRHGVDDGGVTAPMVAMRVSRDGHVQEALCGFSFETVSEVSEHDGTLWVGSVDVPYAGALKK
ncbi:protein STRICTOSIDINE SYNTHASE-LIKE 10-like [Hordeum vulgare]|nr:protein STRICTOSIDINE SYNTHASE-LIKE 10-like [Hordeum vulgare]